MALQFSDTVRNGMLDSIETQIGASAVLKIRTGAPPANVAAPSIGNVGGVATAEAPIVGVGDNSIGEVSGAAAGAAEGGEDAPVVAVSGGGGATTRAGTRAAARAPARASVARASALRASPPIKQQRQSRKKTRRNEEGHRVQTYGLQIGKARAVICRLEIKAGDLDEKRTGWAHIAKVGEWKGHPSGAFQITREHLAACVAKFNEQNNDVVFDYEHSSTMEGHEAPASGWVKKLELRGDDMWALVEWTEKAAKYIKEKEYRFASSVLFFDAPDRESGKEIPCRLHSVALTNTPFMDGLREIALTEKLSNALGGSPASTGGERRVLSMKLSKKAVIKALQGVGPSELPMDAWVKQLEAIAATLEADEDDVADVDEDDEIVEEVPMGDGKGKAAPKKARKFAEGDAGLPPVADPAAPPSIDDMIAQLAAETGMSPDDTMAALMSNIDAIISVLKGEVMLADEYDKEKDAAKAEEKDEEEKKMADEKKALGEKVAALETESAAQKAVIASLSDRLKVHDDEMAAQVAKGLDAEVEALITERRLAPEAREPMRALADKDPAQFRALAQKLKPAYPAGREASALPTAKADVATLDDKDPRVVALRETFERSGIKTPAIRDKFVRAELAKMGG